MTEMTFTTPTSGPALPVYVLDYAASLPYLTRQEYLNDPNGVDISDLVPNGSPAQQAAALDATIMRASSWADSICNQMLAASIDVVDGYFRVRADSTVQVPVEETPIIAVTGVNWGWKAGPANVVALTDLGSLWIQRKVVQIPLFQSTNVTTPRAFGYGTANQVYVAVQYVSGYANTRLSATVAAGSSTLPVVSAAGIVKGLSLTVSDGANTEDVQVASSYVFGSLSVPLVSPTTLLHTVSSDLDVAVTALPDTVKQAVSFLTTCLVKVRGTEAFTMDTIPSTPTTQTITEAGGSVDYQAAQDMLSSFTRVR